MKNYAAQTFLIVALLTGTFCKATAQDMIVREPLLTASPIHKMVNRAELKEITFKPLMKTGRHLHPCPVVGYIVSGTALVQEKGGQLQRITAGQAFYEPANKVMVRFDNASASEPLRFVCCYLINNEKEIIKHLKG